MRLPQRDSATGRSIATGVQTVIGAVVLFATGLISVIQGVPGCGDAILGFLQANAVQLAALFGISSSLVTFVWNFLRRDVKNY